MQANNNQIYANFTAEEFEENDKLIKYFIGIYLKIYPLQNYYDDIYSFSHAKVFEKSKLYDPTFKRSTFIGVIVKNIVKKVYKQIKNANYYNRLSYTDNTISLDAKLLNNNEDNNEYNNTLHSFLGVNEDFTQNFDYKYLLELYERATANEKPKTKKMMDMLVLENYKEIEVAEMLGITRQAVNDMHLKLKGLMYLELKKNNYKSKVLDNYKPNYNALPKKLSNQIKETMKQSRRIKGVKNNEKKYLYKRATL